MTVHKEKNFISGKYLISAEDYQRMGAAGIFHDKERVELIKTTYRKNNKWKVEAFDLAVKGSDFLIS